MGWTARALGLRQTGNSGRGRAEAGVPGEVRKDREEVGLVRPSRIISGKGQIKARLPKLVPRLEGLGQPHFAGPFSGPVWKRVLGAGGDLTGVGLSVDIDLADGFAVIAHHKDELHLLGIVRLRAVEAGGPHPSNSDPGPSLRPCAGSWALAG